MALAENGSLSTHHSHANDDLDNSNPANQLNNNNSDEIAGDSEQPNNLVPADNQIHNLNAAQMNGVTVIDSADTHLAVANGNGHANGFNRNKGNFQSYENLTKSNGHGASDDGKDDGSDSSETEFGRNEGSEEGLKKEIGRLEEFFSNLNPRAAEFVPPSLKSHRSFPGKNPFGGSVNNFNLRQTAKPADANGLFNRTRRNNYGQGKRRINSRTSAAQREEVIRRTVYVSDIDQQVTEEQLALLFVSCGQVVDCRVCGDPNSVLRFAFIEFTDEDGARTALSLSGTMLGYYPVRVLPSKTAIAPVNPTFLPRSEDEREMCARTVYCTNIDKKITTQDVKLFFESLCGEVQRLRLLGDYHHSTRIAFVEFVIAESATAALNCSGVMLGSLPIRVSPSKTPVRPRTPRSPLH